MAERVELIAQRRELEEKLAKVNELLNEESKIYNDFNTALGKLSEHSRAGLYAIFDSLSAAGRPLYDFWHMVRHLRGFCDFYDNCADPERLLQMLNEHRDAEYHWGVQED